MIRYTQAFLQTTRHDGKAFSVRWTAYELLSLDSKPNEQHDSSSDEEDNRANGSMEIGVWLGTKFIQPSDMRLLIAIKIVRIAFVANRIV